jgi:putative oxidoreductase
MATDTKATVPRRRGGLLARVVRTSPASREVDLALVVVRIALAWVFIYNGGAKAFGWFNGPGFNATADGLMSDTAHLNPGGFFALLVCVIELGGAIALILGVGSRLFALALVGDMVMATITVTWSNGIEQLNAGYELNLALAALALVIVLLGAGRFSVDAIAERRIVAKE